MTTEFNEQLKSRLLAFQKAHGLVEDGMVSGETWRQLVDAGSAGLAGSTGAQQQGATAHKSDADAGSPQSSQAVEAIASDHSAASSVHGGTPFYINPDVFDFKPGPKGSNWQKTGCVEIVFGHASSPFMPMSKVRVGVIVWAPVELHTRRVVSVREAQLDSANAATEAAVIVKEMLDSHAMILTEVQPRFVGFMHGAIDRLEMNYKVRGCYPDGRNAGSGADDVVEG